MVIYHCLQEFFEAVVLHYPTSFQAKGSNDDATLTSRITSLADDGWEEGGAGPD